MYRYVAFHGHGIEGHHRVVPVLQVLHDHLHFLGEVLLAHRPHGGDHHIPLEDDDDQDGPEREPVGRTWADPHDDRHQQEPLEEVLYVDALPVVDVTEAASREAVRAAEEQEQEHGPHGEVLVVPVRGIHQPDGVAHQRVGERVYPHHDAMEDTAARPPAQRTRPERARRTWPEWPGRPKLSHGLRSPHHRRHIGDSVRKPCRRQPWYGFPPKEPDKAWKYCPVILYLTTIED